LRPVIPSINTTLNTTSITKNNSNYFKPTIINTAFDTAGSLVVDENNNTDVLLPSSISTTTSSKA
jgi:hypothetical protein